MEIGQIGLSIVLVMYGIFVMINGIDRLLKESRKAGGNTFDIISIICGIVIWVSNAIVIIVLVMR